MYVREAAKKRSVLSGPATKAFSNPPPLRLVAIGTFFLTLKKVFFSLVAHPFSPPYPLSGPATKKRTFFAASLTHTGSLKKLSQ